MKEWLKSKENIKTKRNIIISIILIFSLWYYENYILVDNVFDYMYYSRAEQRLFINENEIETMRYYYSDLNTPLRILFYSFGRNPSHVQAVNEKYLLSSLDSTSQDLSIGIGYRYDSLYNLPTMAQYIIEENAIYILYTINFESIIPGYYDNIKFEYIFSTKTNTLYPQFYSNTRDVPAVYFDETSTYLEAEKRLSDREITAQDLEEIHQWLLYDRILNDFFINNENKTRFSMEDLGDFEIAELNTYYEEGFVL